MKKLLLSGVALGFAAALSATTALADITIATAGPITGQYAAFGEQLKKGAEQAVADINPSGGVNVEKLVLEERDGKTVVRNHAVYQSIEARDAMIDSGMEVGMNDGFDRLDDVPPAYPAVKKQKEMQAVAFPTSDGIATMAQTGKDMSTKYKETSEGGLALNLTLC